MGRRPKKVEEPAEKEAVEEKEEAVEEKEETTEAEETE